LKDRGRPIVRPSARGIQRDLEVTIAEGVRVNIAPIE
jgi:hypothetical protein